jgi:AraC-like DNA-binding protein
MRPAGRPPSGDYVHFHKFPIAGIDPMTASTSRSYPRHTHDQYGVGVIDSGAHRSWSDRGQVEAGPGDLICVNPGEVHDGHPVSRRPRSWRLLYLDLPLVEETSEDVLSTSNIPFTFAAPVFEDDRVRRLFDMVFAHAANAVISAQSMVCETTFLQLFAHLHKHSTGKPTRLRTPTPCIRRATSRIDDDPAARLTLKTLAQEAGLSRYQLIRGFARQLGLTPHAYILQRRVALARRLIRAGQDFADIALSCGFCDQSHLNRCFVRYLGVTPGQYSSRAD